MMPWSVQLNGTGSPDEVETAIKSAMATLKEQKHELTYGRVLFGEENDRKQVILLDKSKVRTVK